MFEWDFKVMSIFLADFLKRFLIMLKLPARISRLSRREKEDAATKREALAQQSQQDLPKRKLDLLI